MRPTPVLVVALVVAVGAAGCVGGGGIASPTPTTEPAPTTSTWTGGVADSEAGAGGSPNATRIERLVHRHVNAARDARGRSALAFDPDLARIARYHSRDMARNGYFSHAAPDGETMADRYDRFGYDCRVSTGENAYATGGENLGTVQFPRGQLSETEIARQIVDGWLDSPGHRENLLRRYWDSEGIGVAVTRTDGRTQVYVTQNFC